MPENRFVVEGFLFSSEREAEAAKNEVRGINYIVSRTDMENPKNVLVVYNRIIDKGLLKTPIGLKFLREVQEMLFSSDEVDDSQIKPIPAIMEVSIERITPNIKKENKLTYKKKMINSIIINVIFVIAIIVMIVIAKNSKNVNIINYENRLKDQYSAWEESLNERESELKEREEMLKSLD